MCEKYSRTTHSDNRFILSYKYYEFMDGDGAGPVGLAYIEGISLYLSVASLRLNR